MAQTVKAESTCDHCGTIAPVTRTPTGFAHGITGSRITYTNLCSMCASILHISMRDAAD